MSSGPLSNYLPQLRRATLLRDGAGLTDGQLLGEFIVAHDDSAFAALVKRHAAMVFGVCRRMVGDTHIAEDAFQAVFLVLARRATGIRPREQVGNWLYGVAVRVAMKAKSQLARRRSKEKQVLFMPHPEAKPIEIWHDVQLVLDEELAQLSDKLRTAVVLCDLEGRPQREVARQLRLPTATLASRLQAGRKLLARRLRQRGIVLSGGALATAMTANASNAAPTPLVMTAARMADFAGRGVTNGVSAQVLQLSEGVMRMMLLGKLRGLACMLAATVLLAAGGFQLAAQPNTAPESLPSKQPAKAESKQPKPRLNDTEYLRRVCQQFRGKPPTNVETTYFVADVDPKKRSKVVEWLIDEKDGVKALAFDVYTTIIDNRLPLVIYDSVIGLPVSGASDRLEIAAPVKSDVTFWDGPGHLIIDRSASMFDTANKKAELDAKLLDRACRESRGTPPTRLESEYFLKDTDPKKREKLLDLLLKDPALAKKLGEGWKAKMLAMYMYDQAITLAEVELAHVSFPVDLVPEKLNQLLNQLLNEGRSEAQILETLSAATLGRLPTETEKKLAIANVSAQKDKKAAWRSVLKTLVETSEAKRHAKDLNSRGDKSDKK